MVAGPLGYEPTDLRFKSPRPSHLRRSRSIARPSHRAASHPISASCAAFRSQIRSQHSKTQRAAASASPGRQAGASSSERTRVTGTDPPLPVSDGSAATTDSVLRAHDHRHPSTTSRWRRRPDRRDSCGHCATIRHWRTRSPYSTSRHRYWVVYSCEAAPSLGRQQADHRLTAGVRLLQRLLPALPRPDPGVRVQIQRISSARPGSCSTGHRCTAIACRLSRLE